MMFKAICILGTRSKSTQSNLRTAYKSRVRIWGINDSEKKVQTIYKIN